MKQVRNIAKLITMSILAITIIVTPALVNSSISGQGTNIGITTFSDCPEIDKVVNY